MKSIPQKQRQMRAFDNYFDPIFQKVLGRDPKQGEIGLISYLSTCLQDQEIDLKELNYFELSLLNEYQDKYFIEYDLNSTNSRIGCTREFWEFISEVIFNRYVYEV